MRKSPFPTALAASFFPLGATKMATGEENSLPVFHLPPRARLLVVAPHCDDEILGSAGLITSVLQGGGQVRVIIMTNGDSFANALRHSPSWRHLRPADFINLGNIRRQESISALASLGVEERNVFFLGYPDAGLAPLWSIHWSLSTPYRSKTTEVDRSPYRGIYHEQTIHAGEAVARDLEEIIAVSCPTMVAFPHPNDQHPDHWSTYAFVRYALIRAGLDPTRLLYLIHRRNWPAPDGAHPRMLPPVDLMSHGTSWYQLPLAEPAIRRKRHGIALHKSQMETMAGSLAAFCREDELFGQFPDLRLPLNQERPLTIISDPVADCRAVRFRPAADLAMVKANRDAKLLLVHLHAQASPKKGIGYGIDVTVFTAKGEALRVCAVYLDQATQILADPGQSLGGRLEAKAGETAIRFDLSLETLGEVEAVMINGFTRAGRREIDRTAWRLLKLGWRD